jgi:GT2 family glycosyltransferase
MTTGSTIELSIIIVGINAFDYLSKCLDSIFASRLDKTIEIIYVDNNSTISGLDWIAEKYPTITIIQNKQNAGYATANNQAIKISSSRNILLLNPDTIVEENAIQLMMNYLDQNPATGIVGPKVLNPDGSFQEHCKRGEARPWEVFCYFSRLSRLFPHNPHFAGYLQGHLDENHVHHVPAISGCCMLIRKEVIDQIGYLDELFFAYQEDSDYCKRARAAGWKVTYYPLAQIIHFGGKGGARAQPYRAILEWHRSYYHYYRKHFALDYFFVFNYFIYLLMVLKLGWAMLINLIRSEKYAGPKRG